MNDTSLNSSRLKDFSQIVSNTPKVSLTVTSFTYKETCSATSQTVYCRQSSLSSHHCLALKHIALKHHFTWSAVDLLGSTQTLSVPSVLSRWRFVTVLLWHPSGPSGSSSYLSHSKNHRIIDWLKTKDTFACQDHKLLWLFVFYGTMSKCDCCSLISPLSQLASTSPDFSFSMFPLSYFLWPLQIFIHLWPFSMRAFHQFHWKK